MRVFCTVCQTTLRYETIPATGEHEFVEKVEADYYLAEILPTGDKEYYMSCGCGKKGEETFLVSAAMDD